MARHTNKLLQHLLENESSKRDFVELVQKTNSKRAVSLMLRNGEFENTTWYVSGQTVGNIMKKLGYHGNRGRPPKKPRSTVYETPRWILR